jgi:hypothetical protein
MKRVYQAQSPTDAFLLKDILDTQDIDAIVKGNLLWITRSAVMDTVETPPSVWVVDDEDYEKAMEVIRGYRPGARTGNSVQSEWKCYKCGKSNEGQFSECRQCGAEYKWEHQEYDRTDT